VRLEVLKARMIALVSLLVVVFAAAAALGQDEASVREDFSDYEDDADGSPTWLPLTDEWVVRDRTYAFTEPRRTGSYTWLTEPTFSDLTFEVEFKIMPVGGGVRAAGMVARSQSSADQYYVHIDSKNSQVIFLRQTREKSWHELDRVPGIEITCGEWHEGKLECEGTEMSFYLDDELITTVNDDTFASGRIGLRAGQGHVVYDDVEVRGTVGPLEEEWVLLPQSEPNDEIDVPQLEGVERFPAVRGQGYFPVLVGLADGAIGAVVRGGAPHVGLAGRLDWIASKDGGLTWSEPTVIADSDVDDRNPSAGVMADGTIVVAYAEASTYNDEGAFDTSVGSYDMYYKLSADGGATWSEKKPLPTGEIEHGSPFGRTIVLSNGTALMPVYGQKKTGIARSTDDGKSWGDFTLVSEGPHNEMSLLALTDEHIIATLRTVSGAIDVRHSMDGGRTFDEPLRVTRDGQHPPDIARLESGLLVMVYGNRLVPYGIGAVASRDDGQTWEYDHRVMLAWDSLHGDCGYPSIVQLEDGMIVVVYYSVGVESDPETEFAFCLRFTEEEMLAAMALPSEE